MSVDACPECLRRSDLVEGLGGHLDIEWRRRDAPRGVLALADADLIALDRTGAAEARYAAFGPEDIVARVDRAAVSALCRCAPAYPAALQHMADAPAVLYVAGDPGALHAPDAVAVVGARRASPYGIEVATALGRGLAAAGLDVVSGLALGVDGAAHAGTLEVRGGRPIAVLAAGPERAYPARHRALYQQVRERGAVVSEFPPGSAVWRWAFVARNRLIAALSAITVVVEATERSGSLTTADFASALGRGVAAVPGRVTSPLAHGTNELLRAGASLVRDAADVLDELGLAARAGALRTSDDDLDPRLAAVLAGVDAGLDTTSALVGAAPDSREVLRAITELELRGLLRRAAGGRYVRGA